MFYFAKLNQNNICVSIETSNKKLEERNDLIRVPDYTPTLLNRKWENNQWSQETHEDTTELERLKTKNEELKASIADLWEVVLLGGAE